jgi:hypothetical protein
MGEARYISKEEWKPIPGFDGYFASSLGHIKSYRRSKKGRILTISKNGYHVSGALGSTVSVAMLVLLAFVGPPPTPYGNRKGCSLARHLDDNPKHNWLTNLAWGAHKDNTQDSIRNGTNGAGSSSRKMSGLKQTGQKRPGASESNRRRGRLSSESRAKIAASLRSWYIQNGWRGRSPAATP